MRVLVAVAISLMALSDAQKEKKKNKKVKYSDIDALSERIDQVGRSMDNYFVDVKQHKSDLEEIHEALDILKDHVEYSIDVKQYKGDMAEIYEALDILKSHVADAIDVKEFKGAMSEIREALDIFKSHVENFVDVKQYKGDLESVFEALEILERHSTGYVDVKLFKSAMTDVHENIDILAEHVKDAIDVKQYKNDISSLWDTVDSLKQNGGMSKPEVEYIIKDIELMMNHGFTKYDEIIQDMKEKIEFGTKKSGIEKTDSDTNLRMMDALNGIYEKLNEKIGTVEQETNRDVAKMDDKISMVDDKIHSVAEDVSRVAVLEKQLNAFQAAFVVMEDRMQELAKMAEKNQAATEINAVIARQTNLAEESAKAIEKLEARNQALEAELARTKSIATDAINGIESLRNNDEYARAIEKLDARNQAMEIDLARTKSIANDAIKGIESLRDSGEYTRAIEKLDARSQALEKEVTRTKSLANDAINGIESLRKENADLANAIEATHSKVVDPVKTISDFEKMNHALEKQVDAVKIKTITIEQGLEKLEAYTERHFEDLENPIVSLGKRVSKLFVSVSENKEGVADVMKRTHDLKASMTSVVSGLKEKSIQTRKDVHENMAALKYVEKDVKDILQTVSVVRRDHDDLILITADFEDFRHEQTSYNKRFDAALRDHADDIEALKFKIEG